MTTEEASKETSKALAPMSIQDVHDITSDIIRECGRVIVGKIDILRDVLIAFLANGHVVLEGVPGLAKTYMARTFASILGCEYMTSNHYQNPANMDSPDSTKHGSNRKHTSKHCGN